MHLFLTGVLPFLAHNHPSAVAFVICRSHNFHASIIPEFLSDEERVKSFCEARQQDELEADKEKQYKNLYNLFVQTPLMQFSPSLIVFHKDCNESILKPLLATKYFTRSLQRCSFCPKVEITDDLVQDLSKVQSLTTLNLRWCKVENQHLEIIINSFPSLETLTIRNAEHLKIVDPNTTISMLSLPPIPPATKTLRSLNLRWGDPSFLTQFIPNFPNLRKLWLFGRLACPKLDLLSLSSSLPLLTEMSLSQFTLENTESLKNLVHLSALHFRRCNGLELSFLTQENSLSELATLSLESCPGLSTSSFAFLAHAPNLRALEVVSQKFNNDCLQYIENMVHLRKLELSYTNITGDNQSLKTLMQNLFQLEELNLSGCDIGNQGAIAGALYTTHSRLRVLNLEGCDLADDDLNGISALKNTLQVLDCGINPKKLTTEALVHCKDLVKLKKLTLERCEGITDLSPLKGCLSLEELHVSICQGLPDNSFKVFSEDPNSFPNLRVLNLSFCNKLTEKVFEHLTQNNHLVYQLKKFNVEGLLNILESSATARNNICQLKALRKLTGYFSVFQSEADQKKLKGELLRSLKNLEEISDFSV